MAGGKPRRRYVAPAALTVAAALVFSCSDCPPEPRIGQLRSAYALVQAIDLSHGQGVLSIPAVYHTEPGGRVLRIIADTLRFNVADSTYTFSFWTGAQDPGEPEVVTHTTTPTPPPHFSRTPGSVIHLPLFLEGPANIMYVSNDTLILSPGLGQDWRYVAIPGSTR